ncbi:MAG: DUF4143 domain-containing protein [Coriobacteriia bacterium]|nr:DUF4143 domain-containing protein [Coriobacteriia bacterium]
MTGYQQRIMDSTLSTYLTGLPAIAIEGAKAVGKTSTAERLAAETFRFDHAETIELMKNGFDILRKTSKPILLDEWQRYPPVWDMTRRLVDEDSAPGQFLLTGSAALPHNVNVHSGAGRIVRLRMRPFSLQERDLEKPAISLNSLLQEPPVDLYAKSRITLIDYIEEILRSGFPAIRAKSETFVEIELDGYIDKLLEKEFPDNGIQVRKPLVLRQWLRAYAAATGTTTSYKKILDASTAGEDRKPAKETTMAYRDALDSLWITDRIEAWLPTTNPFAALGRAPKHFLADPALSARLLRIGKHQLLSGATYDNKPGSSGSTILGRLFESLVAQSLQVYATANRVPVQHFRTSRGDHEVDFIIEGDQRLLAIEAKATADINAKDVQHLNWLEKQIPQYPLTKIAINTGEYAYTRDDGVHVIPASLLGV